MSIRTGHMHAASLGKSLRLQQLDTFLRSRGEAGATSLEITEHLKRPAASTVISELRQSLRARGEDISCEFEGLTEFQQKKYRYRIVKSGEGVARVETA